MLHKALALDSNYDDAMAYLNLLYRLKAAMTDNPQEATSFMGEADTWVGRALETRRHTSRSVSRSREADAGWSAAGSGGPDNDGQSSAATTSASRSP